MGRLIRWAGVAQAILVVAGIACTSEKRGFDERPTVFETDAGEAAAPPACGGRRCSRDLHAIVDDCTQDELERCPADQGCAAAPCGPPVPSAAGAQG